MVLTTFGITNFFKVIKSDQFLIPFDARQHVK